MNTSTEQEIAEGLQQGKRQAWQQLYEIYSEPVWKGISRLVGDDSSAVADIVQETFLAAARSAGNFNPTRGCLKVWLWTIAKRQIALYYRKRKPDILLSRSKNWWIGLNGEKSDWINARADVPPDILQSQEFAALVRNVLSRLPADYQMLLLAKYVDDESVENIAERLNCSAAAIGSKLARARKAFHKEFRKITRNQLNSHEVIL